MVFPSFSPTFYYFGSGLRAPMRMMRLVEAGIGVGLVHAFLRRRAFGPR
jgi:hypothetical protein